MKVLLALVVLATSAATYAASDRAIYDIMYLPKSGTTFGFSDVGLINREVSGDDDADVSGYIVAQTLGHSFTDRFSLAASLNYTDLDFNPDDDSDHVISGVSDPTISARFRAIDEDFTLDILGSVLMSLGETTIESDNDQDNLQGGHALSVGAQLGKKTDDLQWAISANLTHNFKRKYEFKDHPTLGTVDTDSNNELDFAGEILNKLAEKSFLRSFASVKFSEKLEDEDGNVSFSSPSTIYSIGTEYQHLCSADLLLRAGVAYLMNQHDSGTVDSDNIWALNVGATYQF